MMCVRESLKSRLLQTFSNFVRSFLSRYLKSTINNIRLIAQFRKIVSDNGIEDAERKFFMFWVDFFAEAIKSDPEQTIRFPVCTTYVNSCLIAPKSAYSFTPMA